MTTKTTSITIEHQPSEDKLNELGVFQWSIWTKEVSEFPWTYDMTETCYFLEGEVTVIPDGGEAVTMGKGDLVTFTNGMSCVWKVTKDVKKHYSFE